MLVLTAIFQAIGQALSWIIPISESGHSALFHDFANRYSGACSQLTGYIHIGIAIGLFVSFYKLFFSLLKNFFSGLNELFNKRINIKNARPIRILMYMTILSMALFVFYLIPLKGYGNIYTILNGLSVDNTLLSEGISFLITGAIILLTFSINHNLSIKIPNFLKAIIIGVLVFFAMPISGCSVVGTIICFAIILGMGDKSALRYAVIISFCILIVKGIIEICTGVTVINFFIGILALIIAGLISFVMSKLLVWLVKTKNIKFVGIYDISIGFICFLSGVFQYLLK